jgi:anti-sigma-K factor RskA
MSWPIAPAAVALDALDAHERALAERLLAEDPTFRAEVDRLRAMTAALTTLEPTAWDPVPAPPLRADVITAAPQEGTARRPLAAALRRRGHERVRDRDHAGGGRRARRRPLLAAGGLAAVAAAVALALVTFGGDGDDGDGVGPGKPGDGSTIALRPLAGTTGSATLTIAGAEASLRGSGLPPSGAHDYYEAWLADARGRMVSMGTFRVKRDGRVDVHMAVAVDVSRYALVDVSLEPDDGDPGHSDRSVLRADL